LKSEKRDRLAKFTHIRLSSVNAILWRYFSLFAVGLVAVIVLVCYGILGVRGLASSRKQTAAIGASAVSILTNEELTDEEKEIQIAACAVREGAFIFIFNGDGDDLFTAITMPDASVADIWREVRDSTGEWEEDTVYEFNSSNNTQTTFSYVACVTYKNEQAKLLIRYSATAVATSITQMELIVLIVALVALVVAFFISYGLANKFSAPIKDMSASVRKLAGGDYSVQFSSAQYAEIASLSDSLNNMKEEIKKSDDFARELIANVSHDLKTPLTMIKAYASMIMEISGDDKQKREKHLQVIIDESDRLTGLVNDILATSKINANIEQLNRKVFNLTETLYGIINKFSYLQETQGYSIMVDVEPNVYTLADEEKICQVLYNLISNAINYTGADKTVFISLKYVSVDRVRFAARDTGKGIAEEERVHIWDRYYRSKDSHTRPVKGTGLGLNIVKTILKSHGFNFGVESKIGEGSTFFVEFPVESSTPVDVEDI